MDTEEKRVSEEMEEAVKKAVADAHEQAADTDERTVDTAAETENADTGTADSETVTDEADREIGDHSGETGDGTDGAEDESGKEEASMDIFGRRIKKELEKKEEKIRALNDQYVRLMAEFDNFRKRTEKEKSGMYAMGARDVIEKILPVLDNFERGFALVSEEDQDDPFTQGMEKMYTQFVTVLADLGVTPIDAAGKEFDPNLHNAVMHVEDENFGENIVAEELLKGYMYKDTVVRHSMVKVAN